MNIQDFGCKTLRRMTDGADSQLHEPLRKRHGSTGAVSVTSIPQGNILNDVLSARGICISQLNPPGKHTLNHAPVNSLPKGTHIE